MRGMAVGREVVYSVANIDYEKPDALGHRETSFAILHYSLTLVCCDGASVMAPKG